MTKDELFHQLLLRAGAYTARAERSPKEVATKLRVWAGDELSPEIESRVLEALIKDGYIDSERYASKYTRDKALLLHKGPYLIRRELWEKGITDRDIVNAALSEIEDEEWIEALHLYLTPKLRQYRTKARDKRDLSIRLYRAAKARGFEDRHIRAFLLEVFGDGFDGYDLDDLRD